MKNRRWMAGLLAAVLIVIMPAADKVQAAGFGSADLEAYRSVFDAEYYYNTYPDLQTAIGLDQEKLFAHFVNNGIREGRNGNSEFNLRSYITNNQDLMTAYGENLAGYCKHYVELGKAEGRNALPVDTAATDVIGVYSSLYDVSEQRAVNVELAAERINGIVLQPGDEFSFSSAILSRTYENGYVLGPSFAAGREVITVGGGICQVSSTLYVAMISAALPSTERYTHSAPVDYVPRGLDATIAENSKDLKFVNIYSKPLTIIAVTEDGKLTVSLKLTDSNRD